MTAPAALRAGAHELPANIRRTIHARAQAATLMTTHSSTWANVKTWAALQRDGQGGPGGCPPTSPAPSTPTSSTHGHARTTTTSPGSPDALECHLAVLDPPRPLPSPQPLELVDHPRRLPVRAQPRRTLQAVHRPTRPTLLVLTGDARVGVAGHTLAVATTRMTS